MLSLFECRQPACCQIGTESILLRVYLLTEVRGICQLRAAVAIRQYRRAYYSGGDHSVLSGQDIAGCCVFLNMEGDSFHTSLWLTKPYVYEGSE